MSGYDIIGKALYFESHVTLDPVLGDKRQVLEDLATTHQFRVAELLMRKGDGSAGEPYCEDSFVSGRSIDQEELAARMGAFAERAEQAGFIVRRAKLEAAMYDTNEDPSFIV